jgi:hypothetical protein
MRRRAICPPAVCHEDQSILICTSEMMIAVEPWITQIGGYARASADRSGSAMTSMAASRPDATPASRHARSCSVRNRPRWPGTTLAGLRRQDLGQGPKSNTTRQHERPDVIGSSSRAQSRGRAREPLPAERLTNRTQAQRSVPDKDPAEVVRSAGPPPVPPNPGRRDGAHCHDQHKLTQHLPGPEAPGQTAKHRNPRSEA